jgi:ribosomal protein L14E/L6E/L27E
VSGLEGPLVPGQLVVSVAGRDRGKYYLVLEKTVNNMVLVADGEYRKAAGPKKKNIKHISPLPQIDTEFVEKVKSGRKITDLDVRKALKGMLSVEDNSTP